MTAAATASTKAPEPASHLTGAAPVKVGLVGAVSVGETNVVPLDTGPGKPVPEALGAVPVPVRAVATAANARTRVVVNCILKFGMERRCCCLLRSFDI